MSEDTKVHDHEINKNGFWETETTRGHVYDKTLSEYLKNFFTEQSVYDFGCGPGEYTKHFVDNGIEAVGYDGNPNTPKLSNGLCKVADLTEQHNFGKRDWVMSLEVAEHIPKEGEKAYIENLIKHCNKGIVLSWALPGQPGDGHINCQSNEYVITLMEKHGLLLDSNVSNQLREASTEWWFKNTLMCFRRIDSMPKITFCIPSKNNRRYLEACIPSIRKNAYRDDHDIIVFVDADNDGTVEWLDSVKDEYNLKYIVNDTDGLYGIGKAYDKCVEESETDIFMIFHADMMLGKNADLEAFKYLDKNKVVCATRIEPPLHPENGEKIIKDFGMWPERDVEEGWLEEDFDKYVEEAKITNQFKFTNGCFAPWMMYKDVFLGMGGHDPRFASAREDSDVFNRLVLSGFELIQSWQSFVYHLTARGGQFQHGKLTQDHKQKSEEWQKLMQNSTREFIRKWGTNVSHNNLLMPLIAPKFDVTFVLKDFTFDFINALEPWCSKLYIDDENIRKAYISSENDNTTCDLNKKIQIDSGEYEGSVIVEFSCNDMDEAGWQFIMNLPLILNDSGQVGEMEYGQFNLTIKDLTDKKEELIKCHMI